MAQRVPVWGNISKKEQGANMPRSRDDWRRYLEAARRKVSIARYHTDCLEKQDTSAAGGAMVAPSIPVQAHFEGVIMSLMAAVDQVAQAVNNALRLGLKPQKLVEEAFAVLSLAIPEVDFWFKDPIGRDLRRIRVRMIHYSYSKTPQGGRWVVESADTDFKGSRELVAYARAGVEYLERLKSLFPQVEAEIESNVVRFDDTDG